MISKLLEFIKSKQSEIVLAIAVVLISIISFQSGKISALRHFQEPLRITDSSANITSQVKTKSPSSKSQITSPLNQKTDLRVLASKNSNLYHFLWCSGAQKIKEGNKIYFASEQEAQGQGYALASNCQK